MPKALAVGVSYETFKHLNPTKLMPFFKGHKQKLLELDSLIYSWVGNYGISAITFAVEHCLAGRKAQTKYIEKPIMSDMQYSNGKLTEEEKQRQVDLFFARENARRINWKRNKRLQRQ